MWDRSFRKVKMAKTFSVEVLQSGVWRRDVIAINSLVNQLLVDGADADIDDCKKNYHDSSTITSLQSAATIMVVRDDYKIIGLGIFNEKSTLTYRTGWVDDLVVDKNYRRRGIGEALVRAMIMAGMFKGLERLNSTCRPEKIAANNLCLKVGFKLVGTINGTNFYTFEYND